MFGVGWMTLMSMDWMASSDLCVFLQPLTETSAEMETEDIIIGGLAGGAGCESWLLLTDMDRDCNAKSFLFLTLLRLLTSETAKEVRF